MPRVRLLDPKFFTNEQIVDLPFEYRLLFAGLWTLADREGRLEDRPKRIRMSLFPCDSVDCDAGLQALHDAGLVVRYSVGGVAYLAIPAFGKHQKPHPREAQSVIPEPEGEPKACLGLPKADLGEPKADLGDAKARGLSDSRAFGLSDNDLSVVTHEDDDGCPPKDWAQWAAWWKAERGVEIDQRDRKRFVPLAQRWVAAGVTRERMRRALLAAEASATEAIVYLPGYVDRVLASQQVQARASPAEQRRERESQFIRELTGRHYDDRTVINAEPYFARIA